MSEQVYDQVPFGTEEHAPHDLTYETANGMNKLVLRQEGAVIRSLTLGGVEVLTTGNEFDEWADEQPLKINAAHTMLLVGGNEFGPAHGSSRYSPYNIDHSTATLVQMSRGDRLLGLNHVQSIALLDKGAVIIDSVTNTTSSKTDMSTGKHFYFRAAEADIPAIKLVEEDGSDTHIEGYKEEDGSVAYGNFADIVESIQRGETIYNEAFNGSQLFELPGVGLVRLTSSAWTSLGKQVKVDLHSWHRDKTDTMCFEPVVGVRVEEGGTEAGEFYNQELTLDPGESLHIETIIELVKAYTDY